MNCLGSQWLVNCGEFPSLLMRRWWFRVVTQDGDSLIWAKSFSYAFTSAASCEVRVRVRDRSLSPACWISWRFLSTWGSSDTASVSAASCSACWSSSPNPSASIPLHREREGESVAKWRQRQYIGSTSKNGWMIQRVIYREINNYLSGDAFFIVMYCTGANFNRHWS